MSENLINLKASLDVSQIHGAVDRVIADIERLRLAAEQPFTNKSTRADVEERGTQLGRAGQQLEQVSRILPGNDTSGRLLQLSQARDTVTQLTDAARLSAGSLTRLKNPALALEQSLTRGAEEVGEFRRFQADSIKRRLRDDNVASARAARDAKREAPGNVRTGQVETDAEAKAIQEGVKRDLKSIALNRARTGGDAEATFTHNLKLHLAEESKLADEAKVAAANKAILESKEGLAREIGKQVDLARADSIRAEAGRQPFVAQARADARVQQERTRATHEGLYLGGQTSQDNQLAASNNVARRQRELAESVHRRAILESSDLATRKSVGQLLIEGESAEAAAAKTDAATKARITQETLAVSRRYIADTAAAAEATRKVATALQAEALGIKQAAGESGGAFRARAAGLTQLREDRERAQAEGVRLRGTTDGDINRSAGNDLLRRDIDAQKTIAQGAILDEGDGALRQRFNAAQGKAAAEKQAQASAIRSATDRELAGNRDYIRSQAAAATEQRRLAAAIEGERLHVIRGESETDASFRNRVRAESRITKLLERKAENEAGKLSVQQAEADGTLARGNLSQRIQRSVQYRRTGEFRPAESFNAGGLAGQADNVARFAVAGVAFAAVGGIKKMVDEAEEAQKAAVALRLQYEAIGDSASYGKVFNGLLAISKVTGLASADAIRLGTALRGVFSGTGPDGKKRTNEEANDATLGAAKVTAQLNALTGQPIKQTVDQLTATSEAYNTTFEKIADKTAGLNERFGVSQAETLEAMGKLAPLAKEYGFQVDLLGGIVAAAARASGRGTDDIVNNLGRVLPEIQKHIGDILDLYQDPALAEGLKTIQEAVAKNSFGEVFQQLLKDQPKLSAGQKQSLTRSLGGVRATQDLVPIFRNSTDILNEVGPNKPDDEGKSQKRFDEYSKTLTAALGRLREGFLQLGISLGRGGLLNALVDVAAVLGLVAKAADLLFRAFGAINDITGGLAGRLAVIAIGLKVIASLRAGAAAGAVSTVAGVGEEAAAQAAAARVGIVRRTASRAAGGVTAAGSSIGSFGRQFTQTTYAERYAAGAATQVPFGVGRGGIPLASQAAGLSSGLGLASSTLALAAAVAAVVGTIKAYNDQVDTLEKARKSFNEKAKAAPRDKLDSEIKRLKNQSFEHKVDDLITRNFFRKSDPLSELVTEQRRRDSIIESEELKVLQQIGVVTDGKSNKQFQDLLKTTGATKGLSAQDRSKVDYKATHGGTLDSLIADVNKKDPAALKLARNLVDRLQVSPEDRAKLDAAGVKGDQKTQDAVKVFQAAQGDLETTASSFAAGRIGLTEYSERLGTYRQQFEHLLSLGLENEDVRKQVTTELDKTARTQEALNIQGAAQRINVRAAGVGQTPIQVADVHAELLAARRVVEPGKDGQPAKTEFAIQGHEEIIAEGLALQASINADRERRIANARGATEAFNEAMNAVELTPQQLAGYKRLAAELQVPVQDLYKKLSADEISKYKDAVGQEQLQLNQATVNLASSQSRSPEQRSAANLSVSRSALDTAKADQRRHAEERAEKTKAHQKTIDDANTALSTVLTDGTPDVAVRIDELNLAKEQAQQAIARDKEAGVSDLIAVRNATAAVNEAARAFADAIFAASQEALASRGAVAQAQRRPDAALGIQRQLAANVVSRARQDLADLQGTPGADPQAVQAARDHLTTAQNGVLIADAAIADRNRAVRDSARSLRKTQSKDPLVQAAIDIEQANADISESANDAAARNQALGQLIEAQRNQEAALTDLANSRLDLASSRARLTGDSVSEARNQLSVAENNLQLAQQQQAGEAELNRLQAAVNDARGGVFAATISNTDRQISTDLELERITTSEAVARLRNEEATLRAQGDVNQQDFDNIELAIKRLLKQSQADNKFNLPGQIDLPTLYEVRRLNQTPGGSGYNDSRSIVVNFTANNNVDAQSVANTIVDGFSRPSRFGSVPKIY